ncbi:MAG TPA: arylsulfotransferase family protein [Solirubrobacteraceae bacterium]
MVAEPSSQISLLGVPAGEISAVSVIGSHTGPHDGRLIAYSQGDGASYIPRRQFSAGEHVTVRGTLHLGSSSRRFAFAFTVADEDPLPDITARYTTSSSPTGIQRFHSRPDLPAPTVHVTTPAASTVAPGDIFVAAYATSNGPGGPMIFENSGQLVWFEPLPTKISATNLQVQQYEGQQVLTWWQGHVLPQGFGEGDEIIDNTAYRQIAVVHAGNGLHADLHDFQIISRDTALLTAYDPVHCDLASIRGPSNGAISDGVYQEIDLKTGLVRREWHALDHIAIADAYPKASAGEARTAFPFDFFHINSLDQQPNGTMMTSGRNTWTIYTVDDRTGQVLTRIGGKQSTVKMAPGTATAWQHDPRALPDGDITAFDNGAKPKIHPYSRGILERLDPTTNMMTLLAQDTHSPALSAGTQGNVQTLPNGDALIGWGAEPYVSEYSPTGRLLFDADMTAADQSYRAFRFPWTGKPSSRPTVTLAAERPGGSPVAYVSWNGATQVASWRLLAGRAEQQLTPVTTVTRSGFETTISLTNPGAWFELQALNRGGTVLGSSVPSQTNTRAQR